MNDPSILKVLWDRFQNGQIYTFNGPTLIAVNPFQSLPLYTERILESYYSHGLIELESLHESTPIAPHIFAIADRAYHQMCGHLMGRTVSGNQSILVSGESGAGKTESTKFLMKYLTVVGCTSAQIEENSITTSVLNANPLLEAFGNASTTRNRNSSRFGKFIRMQFDRTGLLVGARIETCLLERVRLVKQSSKERNFHIFYQLCAGLSESERKRYHITDVISDFNYLNQTDTDVEDSRAFSETIRVMENLGFDDPAIANVLELLSAILHLGNIQFHDQDDEAHLDEATPDIVANLLKTTRTQLESSLCTKTIVTKYETIQSSLTIVQAQKTRDAVSKTLYSCLFDWIIYKVNRCISSTNASSCSFISILDIFGFEVFDLNTFEQLCINYTNEKLQSLFNQHIFQMEQDIYKQEQIQWSFIDYPDNSMCLDLIQRSSDGIMVSVDDEIRIPGGSDQGLANKLVKQLGQHPCFESSNTQRARMQFTIKHYAGPVSYCVETFCDKNNDALPSSITELFTHASPFVKLITNRSYVHQLTRHSSYDSSSASNESKAASSTSVLSKFQMQLASMIESIEETSPHFIRCLKPNDQNAPNDFNHDRVLEQLQYGGVLEAVKVAQCGYPVRMIHSSFLERYKILQPKYCQDLQQLVQILLVLSKQVNAIHDIQIGLSKVFLRKATYDFLEGKLSKRRHDAATMIRKHLFGHFERQRYQQTRQRIIQLQSNVRMFLAVFQVHRMRKSVARIRIQAWLRCIMAQRRYRTALNRIRLIQKTFRVYQFRKRSKLEAIISIQKYFRGFVHRSRYQMFSRGIVRLQGRYRIHQAHLELIKRRKEARDLGKLNLTNQALWEEIQQLKNRIEEDTPEEETESDLSSCTEPIDTAKLVEDLYLRLEEQKQLVSRRDEEIFNLQQELEQEKKKSNTLEKYVSDMAAECRARTSNVLPPSSKSRRMRSASESNHSFQTDPDNGILAEYESTLHQMKVQLLKGIRVKRLNGKEQILKLCMKNLDSVRVLLTDDCGIEQESFRLDSIEQFRKGTGSRSSGNNTTDISDTTVVGIITSDQTYNLAVDSRRTRDQIMTGLRNILADSALRQSQTPQPFENGKERKNRPVGVTLSERRLSLAAFRRASARRLKSRITTEKNPVDVQDEFKRYKESYEKLLEQAMAQANELQERSSEVVELKKQKKELQQQIQQHDAWITQDSAVKMQMGKRLQQTLLEKAQLIDENQVLRCNL